jgi:hypothetical protein
VRHIQPIEHRNQRILTTEQLAEFYGTDVRIISNNFNRNKTRYTLSKHYFYLEGQDLESFKTVHQSDEQFKQARSLYLWTEKGALLHAKSLNTDLAWEKYDWLVDEYYRQKEQLVLSDALITALLDKLSNLPQGLKASDVDIADITATHLKRFTIQIQKLLEQKNVSGHTGEQLLNMLIKLNESVDRYVEVAEKNVVLNEAMISAMFAYQRALIKPAQAKQLS